MKRILDINSPVVAAIASPKRALAILLSLVCIASPTLSKPTCAESSASESHAEKGTSLFDGKSLAGWKA